MKRIAAQALIERLADWGVDTVFGLPGDGINGIMEGLRRHRDQVRFVLVHHEEAAAFMATAHAKATGKIGVCLATSGPGGIHLLNGLYDAKLDHMPVLAITGMQETSVLGTGYQQEVALDKLYADVAEYDQADPARAGARVATEVPVTGDAREGLRGLLPLLKRRSDTSFLNKYQREMDSWRKKMASLENGSRDPIAPQYLMSVVNAAAADDALLTCG